MIELHHYMNNAVYTCTYSGEGVMRLTQLHGTQGIANVT